MACAARVAGFAVWLVPGVLAQPSPATPQPEAKQQTAQRSQQLPPRLLAARRFLAARGVVPGHRARSFSAQRLAGAVAHPLAASTGSSSSSANPTWTPLGPAAVVTPEFGPVSGRISAIAIDSANNLYAGTTGGGVWMANSASVSTSSSIIFTPLTRQVTALGGALDASISIGALTVQAGGTGVILAGTGDPNDVLDSYYGAGILRSTDGGNTWSLIQATSDVEDNLSSTDVNFAGEGFSGFAWSTVNPQLVVAAVTSSYEGDIVDANLPLMSSEGLFYSTDSGASWHMATITDGNGELVQSATNWQPGQTGNAATAVVWNPVRGIFLAAVRYHGYYQSTDGINWTRLADGDQPGGGINSTLCPTNPGLPGDQGCPIYRGALAVNPSTGDTFAWTVDVNNQDQGIWQDKCAVTSQGTCANTAIVFGTQLNTAALESNTLEGASTIADGGYTLALAAVPSSQDTVVLAGDDDLWKCDVYAGCAWRNTTNSTNAACAAGVGEFQHALAWDSSNPLVIFIGNDSGIWRSTDGIAESGSVCNSTDATHFQNLNSQFYNSYQSSTENQPGSLAEVESLSSFQATPYTLMAGLGVNGTAGVKASSLTNLWPQILSGYGGPVAVDPKNVNNWYVNNQTGVAIYLCPLATACTPSGFGATPVVSNADVGGDGDTMPVPAAFLVDPAETGNLLVATCRVWRGTPGTGWTQANAISPVFSSPSSSGPCNGNALIRSIAAMPLSSGGEIIYAGMYGSATNGSILPGHIFSGFYDPTTGTATWTDLTQSPVTNDQLALNYYGLDVSSIVIDPHDPTGNTVYVTVEGMPNYTQEIRVVYRSTDGGASWASIAANLPYAPASSLAVDPQSANTVYIATDLGVFYTPGVANCALPGYACWAAFGTGLPTAPAVALSAASSGSAEQVLVAATYGRGIWQAPLLTANTALSAASVSPMSLTFTGQAVNAISAVQTVTLLNTGSTNLVLASGNPIVFTGDFNESGDTCQNQSIAPGASCTISVVFAPQAAGPQTGQMTIYANVYGGQISVDLNGTGTAASLVTLSPSILPFGQVQEGTVSTAQSVSITNAGTAAVPVSSLTVTAPFVISGNSCGASSLVAGADCQLQVEFAPTTTGTFTGLLTMVSSEGTQTVELTGTAVTPPADIVNPPEPNSALAFPNTAEGEQSAPMTVTVTNTGGMALNGLNVSISGPFQETSCGTQLAAGAVCTISIVFAPTQTGAFTGTLTIADDLRTQTVALSGTGVSPPVFSVSPTSLTFANQQPGVASAPQTVTITNAGATGMTNIGFSFPACSAAASSPYCISSTNCGSLLAGGASCTAQIIFNPSGAGPVPATLVVSTSTPGVASASIPINGSGLLSGGLTASPAQLNFSAVTIGQTSATQPVTVTNSTGYAMSGLTISAPAPFGITQNTCAATLAAGANCIVSVDFTPTIGGAAAGTLTVSSSSLATPVTVGLSGTGFNFAVSISGSPSQNVIPGQTANYTLVITPAGSTSAFTFACGTLPSDTVCLFSPATETLSSGVQGNVLVEVTTSSSETSLGARPGSGRQGLWRALPLACGLLLLPPAICRRRRIFQLALLFAVLVCGISSCTSSGGILGSTGGSGGQGGGSGTPTGTYTIPVTVTSTQTGLTQSANLSLTVD